MLTNEAINKGIHPSCRKGDDAQVNTFEQKLAAMKTKADIIAFAKEAPYNLDLDPKLSRSELEKLVNDKHVELASNEDKDPFK